MRQLIATIIAIFSLMLISTSAFIFLGKERAKNVEAQNKIGYIDIINEADKFEAVFKLYKKERNKSAFDKDLLTTIRDKENKDGLKDLNYIDFSYSYVAVDYKKMVKDNDKVYFLSYSNAKNTRKISIETCSKIEDNQNRKYPQKIETKNFNDIQGSEISIALGDNKYACFEHPSGEKLEEDENRYVFVYRIE